MAQGNLVAVHVLYTRYPGDTGQATFDILRIQGAKLAEHWDTVQSVITPSVSGNDMFSTLTQPTNLTQPDERASTCTTAYITGAFYSQLFFNKDATAFDRYATIYRQHNPLGPDGVDGAKAALTDFFAAFPDAQVYVKRVIIDGDMVAVHANFIAVPGTLGNAVVDLFRVRGGKVVEHWDVIQAVPATSQNNNTMF